MVKFVIFGQQRTGTTLVVTLLRSHPSILSIGELFDDKEKIEGGVVQTYKLYIKQLSSNRDYKPVQHKDLIYQYLDHFFSKSDFDATGFKLMLNQGKKYPIILDYLKEKQFKVILVVRKNVLNTSISKLRSRQTGIYDSSQTIFDRTKCLNSKIRIPVESLLIELDSVAKQNIGLKNTVSNLGLDYITVFYERLTENRVEETQRILTFLGAAINVELNTQLQKVSPFELKNSVENYEEIVQALKNTPYAIYLE
jgi:LPS sulfotransferase NodH